MKNYENQRFKEYHRIKESSLNQLSLSSASKAEALNQKAPSNKFVNLNSYTDKMMSRSKQALSMNRYSGVGMKKL